MKILHTADIHIGYENHGKIDSVSGLHSRLKDFERSFQFMTEYAVANEVDLFLFCGDAYRDALPSPTEQRIFAGALKPLFRAGIPVVMLIGNHDHPVAFGKSHSLDIFANLLDEVIVISKPERRQIHTQSGPLDLIGLPWPLRSLLYSRNEHSDMSQEALRNQMHRDYVEFLQREAAMIDATPVPHPVILAAHLHIDRAVFTSGSEKQLIETRDPVFSVESVALPQVDYVALGHIHRHQNLNIGARPPVVYSGSIERVSFAEWDQTKGFVIVDFEGKNASYTHIPTPARRFVSIECDISTRNETLFPDQDITGYLKGIIGGYDLKDAVVRLRVTCTAAQKAAVQFQRLREALSSAWVVSEMGFQVADKAAKEVSTSLMNIESLEHALGHYLDRQGTQGLPREKIMDFAQRLQHETHFY